MRALVLDAEWNPKASYDLSEDEQEQHRAMNSANVWQNPELRVEERERPEPDKDEVLVRVKYAGICGSDAAMTETDDDGYMHYSAYTQLPNVIGHEFSGEVVETGDDADLFEAGDPVTAEVTDYCGRCQMCRQGFHGHCENFEQIGFTLDGAFAEYVTVPEKILWGVSELSEQYEDEDELYRAAATIEPSTISFYGLFGRAEGIWPGDYHVYHGVGPIGLTGMNVSRAAGAGKVIAFEPSDERRAIANELGFDHVYNPIETDPVTKVNEVTGGEGADVHVETSGAVGATYPVIEGTLAEQANVVHISNAGSDPDIALRKYQGNSAQIYGSEGHTGQQVYPRTIRLMASGQLDNLPMITSTYDLENADEAVSQACKRVDGKVLIEV
ncbi:alcohol dehydrogenase catalytic domain-containing protein [Haloarcula sp. S1AR25-5A]|uniref:Alcohol dehydrogenase catalytic domain-containing protein n=1 Tax=Haloarcula terrestris TaxID=2950533 RepID=A0AAE4F2Y3_9EURY|nr:scyllo-inosose 3-dehydrogenase [Haloarcula terrestris]MDS0223573.1 alcohol dehydrogenase catalytic domain-containing protein [Haloarcula terrestris]